LTAAVLIVHLVEVPSMANFKVVPHLLALVKKLFEQLVPD
jgi:hypothetical protein